VNGFYSKMCYLKGKKKVCRGKEHGGGGGGTRLRA